MAEFKIDATKAERRTLARAINELNSVQHISYMSRNMLAEMSGIKANKVRIVLQDMLNAGELMQYTVTKNRKLQRYYYALTNAGKTLLQPMEP